MKKINILNINYKELCEYVMESGEPRYRTEQVFGWLAKGVSSFGEMTNVPATLIEKLDDAYYVGLPEVVMSQESNDGTVKCLFRFISHERTHLNIECRTDDTNLHYIQSNKLLKNQALLYNTAEDDHFSSIRDKNNTSIKDDQFASVKIKQNASINDNQVSLFEENIMHFNEFENAVLIKEQDTFAEVEAVFMKYSYGNSICISSQVGCRMGCTFCASTMDGLARNLTAGEMLAEVLAMRNHTGEDIGHIVIMGMGEPFDNYDEVIKFIRLIHEPKGYNLGLRNITVSTCGIVPKIREFAADMPQVNLAISLHAPNQEMRERTMPIAKKYGYDELLEACRDYTDITSRRITFEYALIDGVNDSESCAKELAGRLRGMLCHVNLIPLNEVSGREYRKSRQKNVQRFKETLERFGIPVTVRRSLDSDIDAACGQLRRHNK